MTYPIQIEHPKDIAAAARRLATLQDKGAIVGGGIEILEQGRERHSPMPQILIPLRQIGNTSYVQIQGNEVRIGAATTIEEIAESAGIQRAAWPLGEAAAAVGSPQIRAQSTIAGNLLQRPRCWYFRQGFPCFKNGSQECPAENGDNRYHAIFDGGPTYSVFHSDLGLALHILDATLVIVSSEGEKIVPINQLYMDPKINVAREHTLKADEIIREIRMPVLSNRFTGTFMKVRERGSFDFAIVSVALVYNNFHGMFKGMKIFLGGVAPRPYIPQKTIDTLMYKKLNRQLIPPAADLAAEGATPLSQNAYKIPIVKNLVRKALLAAYEKLSWKPD